MRHHSDRVQLTVLRKEWLEDRLEEFADIFAVAVGGFSVMDSHLHVLVRIDPEVAQRGLAAATKRG